MMMIRRLGAAALACGLLLAGCGGGNDNSTAPSSTASSTASTTGTSGATGSSLEWHDCGSIQCARLEVPVDASQPAGPKIELALARRPASGDRVGTLLVNPGGPGAPGIDVVEHASLYLPQEALERFDIVSWDTRGTGQSTNVACGNRLDYFFDTDKTPDNASEVATNVAAARRLANECVTTKPEVAPGVSSKLLLEHMSSAAIVDDMDLIRAALGEEKLTYLGYSYGTMLGALYATKYPTHVRALVLDGAIDPSLPVVQVTKEQAQGFDSALAAFFRHCEQDRCGFGGSNPQRAYDSLMAQIEAESLPAVVHGEHRELGPGPARLGVANALYFGTEGWDVLADALRSAARGDGAQLLTLSDEYTGREKGGVYDNSQPAYFATTCVDAPAPPIAQLPAIARQVGKAAPEFGEDNAWLGSPCSVWTVPPQSQPGPLPGTGAPPIVVIGTTNDPATPLRWAQSLAHQLQSGNLLVHRGEGHTAYGRGNACIDDAVTKYLTDLTVPPAGTVC
jgi:pimeloyl-ACP methyl ester carboxylesterase